MYLATLNQLLGTKLDFSFKVGSVVQPTQPDGQLLQESMAGYGDGPQGSATMSSPMQEAAQVAPNGDGV